MGCTIIPMVGRPVWVRPQSLSSEILGAAHTEFGCLISMGIVRPSSSQWASPLYMVPKSNGEWCQCFDYHHWTRSPPQPVSCITSPGLYTLCGWLVHIFKDWPHSGLSSDDIALDDICKTAITTPFGMFETLRLPFGLRNAAQILQRLMDNVPRGLDGVFVSIDDVLMASLSL